MKITVEVGTADQKNIIENELRLIQTVIGAFKPPLNISQVIVPADFDQKVNELILSIIGWVLAYVPPYWLGSIIGIVYVISFWTWRGQTPGKIFLGVKIVKTDGSPIGIGRAILRYIGYFVSAIILFIGYLMIAWDSRKQGLHDKIAGTCVVEVE